MTFRELTLGNMSGPELSLSPSLVDEEKTFFRALLDNQSPIMKFWFALMMVNLVMFLFILH